MLQSITLGLIDSISPCALFILLFFVGFLFLTALRKNIIKNAVSFTATLFIILSVFYGTLTNPSLLPLGGVSLIGKILILILGVYGVVHFFYEKDKKEIFSKINKYILSFPVAILFAVLLSLHFLFCSAGTVIVAMMKGVYSVALYLFGFVVPLIIISLVAYILGAKNEEAIDRIRFLRLIGGIILVLIVIL